MNLSTSDAVVQNGRHKADHGTSFTKRRSPAMKFETIGQQSLDHTV